ncbi:hypothetical protein GQ457_16G025230 [Hibiscus cannabinus]
MKDIIGEIAFIQGKQITDCGLIANEIIDDIKSRKRATIVFKVDFQKTYDTVDWDFLDSILTKMSFSCRWCIWINFLFIHGFNICFSQWLTDR